MAELEQRVNFYRDEFKKPDIKLPARQMFQMVVLVMVGFLVVGAYQVWELQSLQEKIARQEKGRDKLNEQYDALLANFVEPAEDPALVTRLRRLSEDAAQKQKLHDFLVKESGKSLFSFASVLDGLADNDIRNVWLTEIRISTDNKRYQLKGITRHADAIPDYIEALKRAEALQGTSFSIFNVERDTDSEALLHFTLSSEEEHAETES